MNEITSSGQLRMSLLRWILVCVPAIVAIGSLIRVLSNASSSNPWFVALDRPDGTPPDWVFLVAWTTLYAMMGIAIAMIINSRRAPGRGAAMTVFGVQLFANYAWAPLFFGMREVTAAFWLALFILVTAIVTTVLFGRIRKAAAWLMLPCLVWLGFTAILNFQIDQRNPDAETLAPPAVSANIGNGQGY